MASEGQAAAPCIATTGLADAVAEEPQCRYAWRFDSGAGARWRGLVSERRRAFDGWARTAAYEMGLLSMLQGAGMRDDAVSEQLVAGGAEGGRQRTAPGMVQTAVPPQLSAPSRSLAPSSNARASPRGLLLSPRGSVRDALRAAKRGGFLHRTTLLRHRYLPPSLAPSLARPPRSGDGPGANLPSTEIAQLTRVFRLRQLFSLSEIQQIQQLGDPLPFYRPHPTSSRTTSYLSAGHRFGKALPHIRAKLLEAARCVDQCRWRLLRGCAVSPRCVEYHRLTAGRDVLYPTHHDHGSLVTVDVMLSSRQEYDGGQFQTLEPTGRMRSHPFEQGDALVFVSHKYHCVAPVERGERRVLIMEVWEGDERACPHRCNERSGHCMLSPQP